MKVVLILFLTVVGVSCTYEERPKYHLIANSLPDGGPVIGYEAGHSLKNINQINQFLGAKNKEFNDSLSWYATESSFGFERIAGKTAKQLVDTVNCLKMSPIEQQAVCF